MRGEGNYLYLSRLGAEMLIFIWNKEAVNCRAVLVEYCWKSINVVESRINHASFHMFTYPWEKCHHRLERFCFGIYRFCIQTFIYKNKREGENGLQCHSVHTISINFARRTLELCCTIIERAELFLLGKCIVNSVAFYLN